MAESANKTNALAKVSPISLQDLAQLLAEMGDYHKSEVSPTTAQAWKQDLGSYSEVAIREAWRQHRMVSGYFPFVSDLKKFLDFRSEPDLGGFKPSSAQANVPEVRRILAGETQHVQWTRTEKLRDADAGRKG
jgi:hypothetical protein